MSSKLVSHDSGCHVYNDWKNGENTWSVELCNVFFKKRCLTALWCPVPGRGAHVLGDACCPLNNCILQLQSHTKQVKIANAKVYAIFINLLGAFDWVDRDNLWMRMKLQKLGTDKRLLFKGTLYSDTFCQGRNSWKGDLTKLFPTNGVKQGYILPSTLFNLFLNDFAAHLIRVEGHSPSLGLYCVPLLIYADNIVILSQTFIDLNCLINSGVEYLDNNKSQLNCN